MNNDFSKQFRPILEIGYEEAQRFESPYISCEHLVLGSIKNKEGYAYRILSQARFLFRKLKRSLVEYLSEPHASVETTTLFEQQYKISLAAIRQLQARDVRGEENEFQSNRQRAYTSCINPR